MSSSNTEDFSTDLAQPESWRATTWSLFSMDVCSLELMSSAMCANLGLVWGFET